MEPAARRLEPLLAEVPFAEAGCPVWTNVDARPAREGAALRAALLRQVAAPVRWEETVRVNLTASFLVARAFLREVERTGHGNLVFVGSTAGLFGEAGHADYAAAKSAVTGGLLLSLKNEVGRIAPRARVNAVCPGWTESPLTRSRLADPAFVRRLTRTMALRKVARPEDVAAQVVVLASDELSGHVTGQVVTVAGGMEGRVLHED